MSCTDWVRLQDALGYGAKTADILANFSSPGDVFCCDLDTLKQTGLFTRSQIERILTSDREKAERVVEICENSGYNIITPDSEYYPGGLKRIEDRPVVLYTEGDVSVLKRELLIGVIGKRKPSLYGMRAAAFLTRDLCEKAVIVSGGAQGIDSVAHESALEAGGKTIAILGTGFGVNYLMDREPMRRQIAATGLLVTEFQPGVSYVGNGFVMRNRITAGICNGVLVVEAGLRSGTISTARRALKYNRDLFVITGDITGQNYLGAQELIKVGARIVFSADEILGLYGFEAKNKKAFETFTQGDLFEGIDDFSYFEDEKPEKKQKKTKNKNTEEGAAKVPEYAEPGEGADENQLAVYHALKDGASDTDEIARKTSLSARELMIALTNLEMDDVIEADAGNKYRIVTKGD